MKILCCILICLSCGSIGIILKTKFIKKKNLYGDLVRFCSELILYINYTQPDLEDIFFKFEGKKEISEIHDNYCNTFKSNILPSFLPVCNYEWLNQEELKEINMFYEKLGNTNIEGQLQHINLYKSIFEKRYKSAEDILKTKGSMYIKLGFLSGGVLIILLI